MKHSDLKKDRHANHGVACSGNKLCRDCRIERKKNKQTNNKVIRKINKKLCEGDVQHD